MLAPKLLGEPDVSWLGVLESPANQMHFIAILSKIHSVSRSEIDPQFRQTVAYWPHVAKIPIFYTVDSNSDSASGLGIKIIEPLHERLGPIFVPANQDFAGPSVHSSHIAFLPA